MTNTVRSSAISRRRALVSISGLGLAACGVAVAGRTVAAQDNGGSPGAPAATVQDTSGPVVVASGGGAASAPADRVLIQLIARSTDSYGKGYDDPSLSEPDAEDGTAVPGPTEDVLQAAVDVLTEAGVDDGDILVVPADGATASTYFGAGAGMVGAELSGQQLASLPEIMQDIAAALTEQGLLVDQPMAAYLADGCADLRAEALAAAVAAAREDAEALAAALGVEVTTLHRATEQGYAYAPYAYTGATGDGCGSLPELADLPRTYLAVYDPSAPLELTVTATVELTMNVAAPEA